jgi:hypothetical protein
MRLKKNVKNDEKRLVYLRMAERAESHPEASNLTMITDQFNTV